MKWPDHARIELLQLALSSISAAPQNGTASCKVLLLFCRWDTAQQDNVCLLCICNPYWEIQVFPASPWGAKAGKKSTHLFNILLVLVEDQILLLFLLVLQINILKNKKCISFTYSTFCRMKSVCFSKQLFLFFPSVDSWTRKRGSWQ